MIVAVGGAELFVEPMRTTIVLRRRTNSFIEPGASPKRDRDGWAYDRCDGDPADIPTSGPRKVLTSFSTARCHRISPSHLDDKGLYTSKYSNTTKQHSNNRNE